LINNRFRGMCSTTKRVPFYIRNSSKNKDNKDSTGSFGKKLNSIRNSLSDLLLGKSKNPNYKSLRESFWELDSSMRYNDYHTLRWSFGIGGLLVTGLYIFRDDVKSWFGSTSADITTRTLGDKGVQREAQNLAQGVVYQLLNDEHALRLTTEFLNQLMERDDTRQAVLDLLANVAARRETQLLFQDLFVRILTQPEFVLQASLFFQDIIQRESTRLAMRNLFEALFADEYAQQLMADFFQHVIQTDTFRNSVLELASSTTHQLLDDEDVAHHAVAWVQAVLGEPDLHYKAGDAIWGAITSTFIPGFLGGGRQKKDSIVSIDEALANIRKQQDTESKEIKKESVVEESALDQASESMQAFESEDVFEVADSTSPQFDDNPGQLDDNAPVVDAQADVGGDDVVAAPEEEDDIETSVN